MQKVSYSKPVKSFYKRLGKYLTGTSGKSRDYRFLMYLMGVLLKSSDNPSVLERGDRLATFLINRMLLLYEYRFTSIFFEDQHLKDFLLETEVKDLSPIFEYVRAHGAKDDGMSMYTEIVKRSGLDPQKMLNNLSEFVGKDLFRYVACHLRIPNETDAVTFVLYAYKDSMVIDVVQDESCYFMFEVDFGDDENKQFAMSKIYNAMDSDYKKQLLRLVVNYIYYILTFPDALINGAPKNALLTETREKIGASRLKTVPDVLEEQHADHASQKRVTHFRRGFFRYLGSDYYRNKKGQYVFVKSALVKGTEAKTLI